MKLKYKLYQKTEDIEESILQAIAEKIQSNIRELEGAFTRTLAYADLHGLDLDVFLCASYAQEPTLDKIGYSGCTLGGQNGSPN